MKYDVSRDPVSRMLRVSVWLIATLCWLAGPPAVAQPVTTFGTLSNFDAINDTGHDCHGFEIELEGVSSSDVVCTFGDSGDPANPYNRYGAPAIVPTAGGAIVRYASAYDSANQRWIATTPRAISPYPATMGHQCWSLGDPNYPTSGCEHYGVCLARNASRTIYRWLIEDAAHPGTLIALGGSVNIPAPVWNVIPQPPPAPDLPPPPPIVIAVLPAPPAPPVPPGGVAQWGEAIWVKIYTMEMPEPVEIEDLVLGGMAVPDPEVEPAEIEWKLLQSPPVGGVSENEEVENGGEVGDNAEAVSRRYEFYKYIGEYDPENNEATCDNPLSGDPRCGPADPLTGVAGVGDLIGAQNAAVNLFEQSIDFTKTADAQVVPVGGSVNYTLTLSNLSTPGSPDLQCTITDALLGLDRQVTVAPGGADITAAAYTVQPADPDPLVNTASVSCSPVGFPDVLTASASWTVDVVPAVEAPVITCPADVTALAAPEFCSAVVMFADPSVSPAGTPVSCDPMSGTTFAAGATAVTCTASNAAGTASCSFLVTVTENPANCADADACTLDACRSGVCEHQPLAGCCHDDSECADADDCTRDSCAANICVHDALPSCCLADGDCTDGDDCTLDACVNHQCEHSAVAGCCRADSDCDDADPCTTDSCVVHACQHSAIPGCCTSDAQCDDGLACTLDTCSGSPGTCQHAPDDRLCDDGTFCNGAEVCSPVVGCLPGTPPDCFDGVSCTVDSCNELLRGCEHAPDAAYCGDGSYCNGAEVCDLVLGCRPGTPVDCNDGDACTLDTCNDTSAACDHVLLDDDSDGVCNDGDDCAHSVLTATIVIGACDSGVANHRFDDGCTMSDRIAECAADAANHGGFVRCVTHLTTGWRLEGLISGMEKGKIQACAGGAQAGREKRRP